MNSEVSWRLDSEWDRFMGRLDDVRSMVKAKDRDFIAVLSKKFGEDVADSYANWINE